MHQLRRASAMMHSQWILKKSRSTIMAQLGRSSQSARVRPSSLERNVRFHMVPQRGRSSHRACVRPPSLKRNARFQMVPQRGRSSQRARVIPTSLMRNSRFQKVLRAMRLPMEGAAMTKTACVKRLAGALQIRRLLGLLGLRQLGLLRLRLRAA